MSNLVQKLDNDISSDFFPEVFTNEIYYSRTNGNFGPVNYTTNLTIKFSHDGGEYYKTGSKEHRLADHQYLILNSGNEVSCYAPFRKVGFNEGMSIFMDPSVIAETAKFRESAESVFDTDPKSEFRFLEFPQFCNDSLGTYLYELFYSIRNNGIRLEESQLHEIHMTIANLMIDSQDEMNGVIRRIPRVKRSVQIELYRKVSIARDYLESNFREPIRLNQLAKIAGLSKYYLIKCFRRAYGKTPYEFVLHKRIENAKKELMEGEKNITSISVANGFSDVSSFSKKFKQETGMAPSQFYLKTA